jgi:2-aminoadipate transaminase
MPASLAASSLAFSALGQRASPPTIARLMTMALENPQLLSLAAGFTDNATLPCDFVVAATQQLLQPGADSECLQYGTNHGRPGLRELVARRLSEQEPVRDAAALPHLAFVTNGSQQALYLAVQVLCDPGDIVLVDRPSYFVFLEMLKGLGVEARSLPVDAEGVIDRPALDHLLDSLKKTGEARRLKAVYFVSYFSNPSARSLSAAEKNQVAEALTAAGLRVPVLEDAAYRDLYFETPHAAASVMSLPAWSEFPRLYFSTLTKPFATGLKVGYGFCSDEGLLKRMLHVKGHHDFGSANFNQALFERVLSNGDFDAQLRRIRPAYQRKMRALNDTLRTEGLPELGWQWKVPSGGLYLWLQAPQGLDTALESPFCRACVAAGVLYVPGELCFGDDAPRYFARLSFGVLNEGNLREAARRFVAVVRQFT